MPRDYSQPIDGEVLTPSERLQELEEEIARLKSGGNGALSQFLSNPGALQRQFNLSPEQAQNVRAILAGAGAGLAVKYLGPIVGESIAGAIGGYFSPIIARKVLGA